MAQFSTIKWLTFLLTNTAFYVQGLENVTRHALLTCMAMLLTTLTAHAIDWPDLSRSPRRLLADL